MEVRVPRIYIIKVITFQVSGYETLCQEVIGSPFDEIVAAHLKYAFVDINSALHACNCVYLSAYVHCLTLC